MLAESIMSLRAVIHDNRNVVSYKPWSVTVDLPKGWRCCPVCAHDPTTYVRVDFTTKAKASEAAPRIIAVVAAMMVDPESWRLISPALRMSAVVRE